MHEEISTVKIVGWLSDNPEKTVAEIAQGTGIVEKNVRVYVNRLVKRNKICVVDKKGLWCVYSLTGEKPILAKKEHEHTINNRDDKAMKLLKFMKSFFDKFADGLMDVNGLSDYVIEHSKEFGEVDSVCQVY